MTSENAFMTIPENSFLLEVPDDSQQAAHQMFDSAGEGLPGNIACYSIDHGFSGLDYGVGQAMLPLARSDDEVVPLRSCYDGNPSPVASSWHTSRAGLSAVVAASQDIQNIKIEAEALEFYTTPRLIVAPALNHLPSQAANPGSNVDNLMWTIQLKSQRVPRYQASSSASSTSNPTSSAPEIRAAKSQQRDRPTHPCRKSRKTYKCSIPSCAKTFYQKAHLEIHIRAHTGYKPFVRDVIQSID